MFNFWETAGSFWRQLYHFIFTPAAPKGSDFQCPYKHVMLLLVIAILVGLKWLLTVIWVCIFMVANDGNHVFIGALTICLLQSCLDNLTIFNWFLLIEMQLFFKYTKYEPLVSYICKYFQKLKLLLLPFYLYWQLC